MTRRPHGIIASCVRGIKDAPFVLFGLLVACTDPLGDGTGALTGQTKCLECHTENGPLILNEADAGVPSFAEAGHAAHREAGISCETCHIMPVEVGDPGHVDPMPTEIVFSGVALSGGASPSWNTFTGRCDGTYCHGGLSEGGSFSSPSFDDGPAATASCESCHGKPPKTGAHERHMEKGVLCTECHTVPMSTLDFGHIDGAPGDVTFGGRAGLEGLFPFVVGKTCQNTYCHGTTLGSGADSNPSWVPLGPGNTDCGSCHGNPPLLTHYEDDTDCAACHFYSVNPDGTVNWQGGYHINGIID